MQVHPDAASGVVDRRLEPKAWPPAGDTANAAVLHTDARWAAVRVVVESRHFARSPLLSKFLLHVVTETLEGRQETITEHQIGVRVFGRPASYRTVEDNIVRNYARQLRKRLAEHFAEAPDAAMQIEIPVGGYIPVFTSRVQEHESPAVEIRDTALLSEPKEQTKDDLLPELRIEEGKTGERNDKARSMGLRVAAMLAYSAALIAMTALVVLRWHGGQSAEPSGALWHALLDGPETTYVVPPDAGFNLVEDISHRSVPLAEYMHSSYSDLPMPQLDAHSVADLRSQQLTDFVDVQLMVAISRLKEYKPERVFLRFPRDLRLDDLKNANAILIGSVCSNPWAAVKDARANFVIVCGDGMQGSTIMNRVPKNGEEGKYASHWNEPTHATYALISYLPNLSGSGHLLLLEGLDVAGTQAAAEAMLASEAIAPILKEAHRPDGSIAPFEVLLKATSIEANATDTQVIASRIH